MSPRNVHGEMPARKLDSAEIQNLIMEARAARSKMISHLLISGYHDARDWFGNLINGGRHPSGA